MLKKQKICIIGGSLTGLVTAINLSKLNCEIDLITGDANGNSKSNRTTAISQNNFDFFEKLDISGSLKKYAWPCSKMKLYTENKTKDISKVFELNNEKKRKKVLYMLENSKIIKLMLKKIKKTKSISIIRKKISHVGNSGLLKSVKYNNKIYKYNLIILCTGSDSNLVKKIFGDQKIENTYNEASITTVLKHRPLQNNTVRQIFLENEILALLPISSNRTSIVWSLKKEIKKSDFLIKERIKFYTKNYLKNIEFKKKIEYRDLNFLIRKKYYKDRTLLFGDALHVIHPFAGQGFNMILRDLASLAKILNKKINLGLDIGSSDILAEFSDEMKSKNFIFSVGVDFLKNYFSIKNKYVKEIRNNIFKVLNKNNFIKNIFFNIADKGLKF